MKRLLITTALAVVGVGTGVTSAQAAVVFNETQTIPFEVFVPCANGGAGEVVSGTVDLHILISLTVNGNHLSMKEHFQPQSSNIIGETTGDQYQATRVGQDMTHDNLQNGQFNTTVVNDFGIIGPRPDNNLTLHDNVHIAFNANGELTVAHENVRLDCK